MKFLIDECLSPSYVRELSLAGYPDAIHPGFVGLAGSRDEHIVARAFADDRVIVTSNARDYRRILATVELHPGAILLEALNRDRTWHLLCAALAFIEAQPDPAAYMINRVIEVSTNDGVRLYELPSP